MINRIPNSSLGVWTPLANLFGVSWNLYFQMLYAIHLYPSKVQIVCLFFIFIKILSRNYRTFSGSYDTWQTISYKLKTCFNWLLGACNERTSLRTGRYDKFIPWNTKYKAARINHAEKIASYTLARTTTSYNSSGFKYTNYKTYSCLRA